MTPVSKLIPVVFVLFLSSPVLKGEEIVRLDVDVNASSTWPGIAGRIYFVQWSEDLINWDYVPVIYEGVGPHTVQYQGSAVQIFCRIKGVHLPSIDPDSEDFDDDGVSNLTELTLGLDPLNSDSDGDGFGDGVEIERGTDPKLRDHAIDWQGTAAIVLTPTR